MFYLQSEVQAKSKQEFPKGPFTYNLLTIFSLPSKGCWKLIVIIEASTLKQFVS